MQFNYIVRTKEGEIQSGTIVAPSLEVAIQTLQSYNLIVISCQPAEHLPLFFRQIKIFQRVKTKEMVSFFQQLAILYGAKVPLVQSFNVLARQQKNSYFRDILLKIGQDVEAGLVLSRALAKYPKEFSLFYINLIKSGEVSGNLEDTFNYLAEHLEKQYYLTSRIRGAMIYPAFILGGFIFVLILMLTMVIPKLVNILKESGQELPFLTRMIIDVSDFFISWWWLILLVIICILIAGWQYHNKPEGKRFFDLMKLKIPIFGPIFQKVYLARFSENLGTLIKGGLPILQALQISSEVVGNEIFASLISEAKEEVKIGNTISSVFERYSEEIPPMVTQMISIGEKSGQLDFVLGKIANFYTREVDNTVKNLSGLIEPILIVILGVGVGILLIAILKPIYNLASGL